MSSWTFIEHATDYLLRPRLGDKKHPTLWPSEASAVITNSKGEKQVVGKCRRAGLFRYLIDNYKFYDKYDHLKPLVDELVAKSIPPDRYMLWIWAAGNLYEDHMINLAKSSGVYMAGQTPLYIKEYNISGKIDLVVVNPETHKLSNVEIKSVYGFGADSVAPKKRVRDPNRVGTPRDSNLMQIAIYEWWGSSADPDYEPSRLVYGARDTGRYSEFNIWTETDENETIKIFYQAVAPRIGPIVESPITINSILQDGYTYIQKHLDAGKIPPRDFDLKYSLEKLDKMYADGELGKIDTERYNKIAARPAINAERIANGKTPLKPLVPIDKGDWQCGYCKFKNSCYNSDKTTREI